MSLASDKSSIFCWVHRQLHYVKGMQFVRHTAIYLKNGFTECFCIMIALTKLFWTQRPQGQRRRRKSEIKERGRKWRNNFGAQTGILNLFVEACKQEKERGLILVVIELSGLPVTVASLAYWQTYTLQTLVCIFQCFTCQCTHAHQLE